MIAISEPMPIFFLSMSWQNLQVRGPVSVVESHSSVSSPTKCIRGWGRGLFCIRILEGYIGMVGYRMFVDRAGQLGSGMGGFDKGVWGVDVGEWDYG